MDPASPAAEKGVKPGDVIVEVAQDAVNSVDDITKGIDKVKKAGRKAVLLRLESGKVDCASSPSPWNSRGYCRAKARGERDSKGSGYPYSGPGGSVPERHNLIDTIADQITPVHADGYKFLALAAGVDLVFLSAVAAARVARCAGDGLIAYFFRDPPRVTPLREGLVLAPGDGKICAIERLRPAGRAGSRRYRTAQDLDLSFHF